MRKQVALMGGGDWADASVCHVEVPVDLDMDNAYREFESWRTADRDRWIASGYMWFPEWLKKNKDGTESSVEEFWED